jgi:membrane associated rhomboid family serine protease
VRGIDIAGLVALVLAIGVAVGFAGLALLFALAPEAAGPAGAAVFGTLGGAMVGSLATYLGARSATGRDDDDRRRALEATQQWMPPPIPERPERPH